MLKLNKSTIKAYNTEFNDIDAEDIRCTICKAWRDDNNIIYVGPTKDQPICLDCETTYSPMIIGRELSESE